MDSDGKNKAFYSVNWADQGNIKFALFYTFYLLYLHGICRESFYDSICSDSFPLPSLTCFSQITLHHRISPVFTPHYPVVLCWCHHIMELVYLLYLNGSIKVSLSWQSPTLDPYDEKSTLYRHLFLCGYAYRPQKASGQIWINNSMFELF